MSKRKGEEAVFLPDIPCTQVVSILESLWHDIRGLILDNQYFASAVEDLSVDDFLEGSFLDVTGDNEKKKQKRMSASKHGTVLCSLNLKKKRSYHNLLTRLLSPLHHSLPTFVCLCHRWSNVEKECKETWKWQWVHQSLFQGQWSSVYFVAWFTMHKMHQQGGVDYWSCEFAAVLCPGWSGGIAGTGPGVL